MPCKTHLSVCWGPRRWHGALATSAVVEILGVHCFTAGGPGLDGRAGGV